MKKGKSLLTLFISTILSLCALEMVSRMLPKTYYDWGYRHLFLTQDSILNKYYPNGESIPWYKPNTSILTAAYYKYSPTQVPIKEYSNWLTTNNIGLVQRQDFNNKKDSIAIFGDSFTESQATTPWIYGLERGSEALGVRSNQQILNFGYQGTGIGRWNLILKHDMNRYRIEKAVFVAIAQDFARLQNTGWSKTDLECLNSNKICPHAYWQKVPHDVFDYDDYMSEVTNKQFQARHNSIRSNLFNNFYANSEFFRQAHSAYIGFKKSMDPGANSPLVSMTNEGIQVFNGIINDSKLDVRLVLIPERHEASRGELSDNSKQILKKINLKDAEILICELNSSDYYPHDGHPNDTGANKIRQCVANSIRDINS